ncbi:MAG: 16S rRNA (guanine(527)-N(7))-methyltransferase RsmG [Bacteroidales bacterium]|nr:16S rRNA (guanine(527)-N(7))-methyltransferase RsmG [Bacteroidales bacterium]
MKETLLNYFPQINKIQIENFIKFSELFLEWNAKINLISRKDTENLFVHHILHSLSIARIFNFKSKTNIIDVGTGGGFPGIPLAIMFPDVNFELVDSIAKKILVVNDICKKLNIKNVKTINSRVEFLAPNYDIIVSRAVTGFTDFYNITKNLFREKEGFQQGIIYLKGGDIATELKDFKNIKIYLISDFFEEEYFETKKIIFFKK